jgi:hypothetical protein
MTFFKRLITLITLLIQADNLEPFDNLLSLLRLLKLPECLGAFCARRGAPVLVHDGLLDGGGHQLKNGWQSSQIGELQKKSGKN